MISPGSMKYSGGDLYAKDTGSSVLVGFGVVIAIIGFILCFFVCVEIAAFRKLRFQLNRLVFVLLFIQALVSLSFALYWAPVSVNTASASSIFACPHWVPANILNAAQYSGMLGSLLLEGLFVSIAGYSLFYIKREISVRVEFAAYGIIAAIVVSLFVWMLLALTQLVETGVCGQNTTVGYHTVDGFLGRVDPAILLLSATVLVAYFGLFVAKRRQKRLWKQILESTDLELLNPTARHVRVSIIRVHKEIVTDVVEVLNNQLLAFAVSCLGYVVLVAGSSLHSSVQTEYLIFICSVLIIRNMQAALQALAYMYSKENKDNFTISSFKDRLTGTPQPHVQFELDEIY
eukprot:m.6908 g.6908  ORF g.6908 m.6908 type:complete len:346 (+) comp3604_c0_seq2:186-1223(+)